MKEQKRLRVLKAGKLPGRQAAELLDLSVRQVSCLMAAYREKGAAGLANGNRGQISTRRTPEAIRE